MAEAKVKRSETEVTLTLSAEEAAALLLLTGAVLDKTPFSELTSKVYHALHRAGFDKTSFHCPGHVRLDCSGFTLAVVERVAAI